MLKRIGTAPFVALVVSVLAGGLSAGAAQASPTYFTCAKLSGPTGDYAGPECAKKAPTPGTGAYERESAVGVSFSGSAKSVDFKTPSTGGSILCSGATAKGKITGASTAEEQITFEDCTYEKALCFSAGQKKVIVTNELETELVGTEASPQLRFQAGPGEGGFSSEFHCGEFLFRVGGFVDAALITPAGHASEEQVFEAGGETTLQAENSFNGGVSWIGPFATEEISKPSIKSLTPIGLGAGNEVEEGQPVELFGSVQGTVTAEGNPVEEAIVVVCKVGGGECYEGETAIDGTYNIEEIESGTYEAKVLSYFDDPYEGATSSQFTVKNEAENTVNFALTKAATGSVEGTVTAAAAPNGPIAHALVRVCVVGGHEECYVVETGPSGTYEAPDVRDGSYTATVIAPFESFLETATTGSFAVTTGVESVQNVALTEEPTGSIEGTVTGDVTHEGVRADLSACLPTGRCFAGESNSSGQYEIAKVPVGTYAVTVYPIEGYGAVTVPSVTVTTGQETLANASVSQPKLPPGRLSTGFPKQISPATRCRSSTGRSKRRSRRTAAKAAL